MALGCVRDSKRRIHRPVVSEFDQGGGSGADEPGTSNPNRVAVFFYLSQKSRFLFLTVAERAEIDPFFYLRRKCSFLFLPRAESAEIDPFFTCAESAVFSFLPWQKAQFSAAVLRCFLRCYHREDRRRFSLFLRCYQ